MKRPRPDLLGIDFASILRKGAANMLQIAEHAEQRRVQEARKYRYDESPELQCLVFQERSDLWRIETIQPGPGGMGIVTARDTCERFLLPELRALLIDKLVTYGVARDRNEARGMVHKMRISVADTIRLRDSERFEGERGGNSGVRS